MINKFLKFKCFNLIILVSTVLFNSCYYTQNTEPKPVNLVTDKKELAIAKESLRLIAENKTDSVEKLIDKKVLESSQPAQLNWLYESGRNVLKTNEYPSNSNISVIYVSRWSLKGYEVIKVFNFPFINKNRKDSTMHFQISVNDNKIYTLLLSPITQYSYSETNYNDINHGAENINDSTRVIENYYENGQMESRSVYVHGRLYGKYKEWYSNGQLKSIIEYKNGKRNGITTVWYANGQKQEELLYKNNDFVKYLKRWDKNGHLVSETD